MTTRKMTTRKHNDGNALAELVILLPLYVLILLGMVFIGDLTGIRTRLWSAVEQTAARPQTQIASRLQRQLFSLYPEGELTLEEDDLAPFPPPGEMGRMIDILVNPPREPWATGSWEFRNGQLVPVINTGYSQRRKELGDKYLEDNVPELLELTMKGYMHEALARGQFFYAAGYLRVGPVSLAREGELAAKHRAFARGELERTVEGETIEREIDNVFPEMESAMPRYLPPPKYDRSLWLPDQRRQNQ